MRRVVFASGLWNLALVPGIAVPGLSALLGLRSPHPFWGAMLGSFLAFAGVVLIFASRDLPHRAGLALWDALLRIAAAGLLLTWGRTVIGPMAWPLALTDLLWALVLFNLPWHLGRRSLDLLLDRA